jgi:Ethanolamine utilization protein EutJ (predicted chaperonin)
LHLFWSGEILPALSAVFRNADRDAMMQIATIGILRMVAESAENAAILQLDDEGVVNVSHATSDLSFN